MAKTFCIELLKIAKYSLVFQRFNKGYKNLPTTRYKNGIRISYYKDYTEIYIIIGVYKLTLIINKQWQILEQPLKK